MKNLFFKELKLSIHPLCYIFALVFGVMGLIPNYPAFIGALYILVAYTFLFLGANKGQTTNDLLYTCNLPIRKQDAVKARIVSINFIKLLTLTLLIITLLIRFYVISPEMIASGVPTGKVGFEINQGFILFGLIIFGLSIADLIYLPWFYKTGKSIVGPSLVSILVFTIFCVLTTMLLGNVPEVKDMFTVGGEKENIVAQILVFVGLVGGSVGIEFATYFLSKRNLIRLDF